MGRELRKVPPNWNHPKIGRYGREDFQPMYDQTFEDAAKEWKEKFIDWTILGNRPDYCSEESKKLEFWEWDGGPPDREYYRPWKDEEATWYQVWETVSEGTPVTPPFETQEELIVYLVTNGDYWDQKRGDSGWSRTAAERFVKEEMGTPSFIVDNKGVRSGVEALNDPN